MIFSENRYPPRIKCGAGFFGIMLREASMMRAKPGTQSLASAGALIALLLAAAPAAAQTYPAQDIHLICGYPAGSGADIIVRYYAEKLRPLAGRTVLVDNKTGAMGNIATEYVARARPDGHTVYLNGAGVLAASMYVFKKPPVDVGRELQVVAAINRLATMLAVRANAPWQSLAELTAYLKQKGDKASYAAATRPPRWWARSTNRQPASPPCRSSTRPASTPPTT